MELARIRNKSRREEQQTPQQAPLEQHPTPAALAEEASSALSLPEDIFDLPHGAIAFPGPAPGRGTIPAARTFDPLALILQGREQDRAAGHDDSTPELLSVGQAVAETNYEEFLCFRLGSEEYGISIMEIKEIIKPRELTEVPRMPSYLDGVLSLRGVIVPVYALRRRLNMPCDHERAFERIIIVRCDEALYGLRVDRVTDVVRIVAGQREAAPAVLEGAARDFVAGIGRADKRMIIIMDIPKVVDTCLGEGD